MVSPKVKIMDKVSRSERKESNGLTSGFIVAAIVSAIILLAAISGTMVALYWHNSETSPLGSGQSGGISSSVFAINNTSFKGMDSVPAGVLVNNSSNTINVTSKTVTLVVEAAPTWYHRQGDFWLIYGQVNPTITIKQGTTIRFVFINMDNITHTPAITTVGPPYSYMPMQGGMMGYQNSTNSWPAIGPMLTGVSAAIPNTAYAATSLQLSFNSPGNFWYICLVPGHAQMGMYGNISVQQY